MLKPMDCLKGTILAAAVVLVEPGGARTLASTVLIESQTIMRGAALVGQTLERVRGGRIHLLDGASLDVRDLVDRGTFESHGKALHRLGATLECGRQQLDRR